MKYLPFAINPTSDNINQTFHIADYRDKPTSESTATDVINRLQQRKSYKMRDGQKSYRKYIKIYYNGAKSFTVTKQVIGGASVVTDV